MAKQDNGGTRTGDQPKVTQKGLRQMEQSPSLGYRQPKLGSERNQRSYRDYSRG